MLTFDDRTGTQPSRKMNLKTYRKWKLKMLRRDFFVDLTEEEIAHAETLKTEAAIDQFCMGILEKRWG